MENSIFRVETRAIDIELDIISKSKYKKLIICLDSFSVLRCYKQLENPVIIKLLSRLDSLSNCKEILTCWIPSPIGVRGNGRSDTASQVSLSSEKFKIHMLTWNP